MEKAQIVNRGIDTLVLNAFHTDERGEPVKRDLSMMLRTRLDEWKHLAQETHEDYPTSLVFNGAVLHMSPNGTGRGQWPWMLKTKDMTLYVSGGHWNGIASVRLSSQYLWSSRGYMDALQEVQTFLDDAFKDEMCLQVSSVDLCVDVAGWQAVDQLDRSENFVTRSRKRGTYEESEEFKSRDYALGLKRTGFDFSRDKRASSSLSCRIYNKSREVEKSGKEWFFDLWRARGWSETDGSVWRVEFSFKREALHELRQEVGGQEVFHSIDDAYELPDRLAVLWAYAAGQINGGPDGEPDGWLRCVLPGNDRHRSRWVTHPVWQLIQGAFLEDMEMPPQFGKIVRKKWEKNNVDKGIEAVMGYLTSLAAWSPDELPETGLDLSVVLHWLAIKGQEYLDRVERDFSVEVQRKRIHFGTVGPDNGLSLEDE